MKTADIIKQIKYLRIQYKFIEHINDVFKKRPMLDKKINDCFDDFQAYITTQAKNTVNTRFTFITRGENPLNVVFSFDGTEYRLRSFPKVTAPTATLKTHRMLDGNVEYLEAMDIEIRDDNFSDHIKLSKKQPSRYGSEYEMHMPHIHQFGARYANELVLYIAKEEA